MNTPCLQSKDVNLIEVRPNFHSRNLTFCLGLHNCRPFCCTFFQYNLQRASPSNTLPWMCFIEKFYCKNFDGSHYGYGRNKIQVFYWGVIHIFNFSKYIQFLLLKNWVSQFIVKYKIKKPKKLNCKNERDFIIGSQIKRQFDFRFDNLENFEKNNPNDNNICKLTILIFDSMDKIIESKFFWSKRKSKLSINF